MRVPFIEDSLTRSSKTGKVKPYIQTQMMTVWLADYEQSPQTFEPWPRQQFILLHLVDKRNHKLLSWSLASRSQGNTPFLEISAWGLMKVRSFLCLLSFHYFPSSPTSAFSLPLFL